MVVSPCILSTFLVRMSLPNNVSPCFFNSALFSNGFNRSGSFILKKKRRKKIMFLSEINVVYFIQEYMFVCTLVFMVAVGVVFSILCLKGFKNLNQTISIKIFNGVRMFFFFLTLFRREPVFRNGFPGKFFLKIPVDLYIYF